MINKKGWLMAFLFVFGLTFCAVMQSDAQKAPPLPNDINIVPPAPDLPKELAAFSGKWSGTWDYTHVDVIMIVEEIHDSWAQVVYCNGQTPRVNAGNTRQRCKVIFDQKPKIEWIYKKAIIGNAYFEVKDSNTLEGIQTIPTSGSAPIKNTIILKRAN